jgi:hypothetical protein
MPHFLAALLRRKMKINFFMSPVKDGYNSFSDFDFPGHSRIRADTNENYPNLKSRFVVESFWFVFDCLGTRFLSSFTETQENHLRG